MQPGHLAWPCFGVLFLAAFLPWADIDMRAAADRAEGSEALVMFMASAVTPIAKATAWNAHAKIGTAAVPVWTALLADALAACCAMFRARGGVAVPAGASRVLAILALALILTFGLQVVGAGTLLAGFWLAAAGALGLTASVMRDRSPTL